MAATLTTEPDTDSDEGGNKVVLVSAETPAFKADWTKAKQIIEEVRSKQPPPVQRTGTRFSTGNIAQKEKIRSGTTPLRQQDFPNGWSKYAKLEGMLVGTEKIKPTTRLPFGPVDQLPRGLTLTAT